MRLGIKCYEFPSTSGRLKENKEMSFDVQHLNYASHHLLVAELMIPQKVFKAETSKVLEIGCRQEH